MHGFPGGGHMWFPPGCVCGWGACVVDRGYAWLGGVHGWGHAWLTRGACMVSQGRHAWGRRCMVKGACMVKGRGACVAKGGMHGEGGHAWQKGGMCGKRGVCMAKGGACVVKGVCVAKGACMVCTPPSTRYGQSMHGQYASYWMHSCCCVWRV